MTLKFYLEHTYIIISSWLKICKLAIHSVILSQSTLTHIVLVFLQTQSTYFSPRLMHALLHALIWGILKEISSVRIGYSYSHFPHWEKEIQKGLRFFQRSTATEYDIGLKVRSPDPKSVFFLLSSKPDCSLIEHTVLFVHHKQVHTELERANIYVVLWRQLLFQLI